MSECTCKHIRYLNGSVARAIDPECKAHRTWRDTWEYAKSAAVITIVFGVMVLLFWAFAQTCKDPSSNECRELVHKMQMSGD